MLPFLAVILNKNFRNLWLAQVVSQIAINMMAFVLVLRVYQTTSSNTAVSLLILTIGIPAIFFGAMFGTLVDRWDKRNVMVVTNLVRMVLLLGFFASSETLAWVYLLVLAISITTQFFVPSEGPTIPRLVPREYLLTANALFTFTYYTSVMIGFILSGPVLRFFGPHNVFLFLAFCLALAAVFVAQIPSEGKKNGKIELSKKELWNFWQDFLKGLHFISKKDEVSGAMFLLTASQALIASMAILTPGFAHRVLQIEVADASYTILGPAAIGMISGALFVGQFGRKIDKKKLMNLGIISTGIFLLLLATLVKWGSLPLAVILLFFLGAANALIAVPCNAILQEKAPAEIQGRIYGVLTSLIGGAAILPVVITGLAADVFGIGKVMFAIAALITIFGIYRVTKERYNNNKVLSIKY